MKEEREKENIRENRVRTARYRRGKGKGEECKEERQRVKLR